MLDNYSKYNTKVGSYWIGSSSSESFSPLEKEIEKDVVVVGGGIAGVTTALELQRAGYSVAVLEKNNIASGTTGGTTGKVTVQQGIFYSDLISRMEHDSAKSYADAYMTAFSEMEKLVKTEKIDCDWQEDSNYVYTTDKKNISRFREEAEASARLGLPAEFTNKTSLPFVVQAAVKFSNQAKFDAYKYTKFLAEKVNKDGNSVFENSEAEKIKEDHDNCYVKTKRGKVNAKYIVVATKVPPFPLIARFTYAAFMYPETSYISMFPYEGDLKGMYISPDSKHRSLLPFESDGKKYLLIGGKNHIPGLGDAAKRMDELERYGKANFNLAEPLWKWKAMDYIAYDELPVIGKLYPWSKRTFVIAGFKKWGLVSSMVAAKTILSEISGSSTKMSEICYPHRLKAPLSAPRYAYKKIIE